MERLKIYIKGEQMPQEFAQGDWIDLAAAKDYCFRPGDSGCIDLGIAAVLPEGYEAHIVPRSSTFGRYGLIQTNGVGIIDNSYCGDNDIWKMPVYATASVIIRKGTRLCQFRIVKKMPEVELIQVETTGKVDRGGLGSTGV